LFPGLAVAEALRQRGGVISLLVSPKEVDQWAVQSARDSGMEIHTLPAVALTRGSLARFVVGCVRSLSLAHGLFRDEPPAAVLGMGGFTSAPPVLAGKLRGALTLIHEANSIPGRANRWLAPWVDQAFVFFPSAEPKLSHPRVRVSGMPVRPQFQPMEASGCRRMLGLQPMRPTLLVTGGSQGAQGLNELVVRALPRLRAQCPDLQYVHLTGSRDFERVRDTYDRLNIHAFIKPFLSEMELAMNAATVAVSRAGASSIAELAALQVPAVLVPYPAAADNHQYFNARALVTAGAAWSLEQTTATADALAKAVSDLIGDAKKRAGLSAAIGRWHVPRSAAFIADCLWQALPFRGEPPAEFVTGGARSFSSLADARSATSVPQDYAA
jgi:UDP-N-acetylglucosamine--N-acetylmuramyl-(pentapeptide) pyrophosphoryl-undecaprenol N-acetylglucosamine transferase